MKFKKKLLSLATAIALGGVAATAQAGTGSQTWLTFSDNTSPAAGPLPYTLTSGTYDISGAYTSSGPVNTNAFSAGNEFRMISPSGAVGGGGEKTITDGGQEWHISSNGVITTVGTDITPTTGSDGLWQNAVFFGPLFGFVNADPTSLVKDFAAGTISMTWTDGFVAEWGGTYFPLGHCSGAGSANQVNTDGQGCGITLSGTLMGTPDSFEFWIWGDHRITPWEDTAGGTASAGSGFAGWTAQWELHGTGSQVPVPAAVWLFGSGLLGLVGVARRKKKSA